MAIDTDDLTDKTYKAIIIEAERFDHNLTLQFGLLSYECRDEVDFIQKSKLLIKQMLKFNEASIDDMFFGEPPAKKVFHSALNKILENIESLENGN
jgi:hypothetical protein